MAITFAIKRLTSAAILQPSSSKHCGPVMVDSGDVLELVQSYNAATDALKKSQAERDALAARVINLESLHDSGEARLELITDIVNAVLHKNVNTAPIEAVISIGDILDADRSKCLAEIKAEAGRIGYLQALADTEHRLDGYYGTTEDQDNTAAEEYAAKIRKGEL